LRRDGSRPQQHSVAWAELAPGAEPSASSPEQATAAAMERSSSPTRTAHSTPQLRTRESLTAAICPRARSSFTPIAEPGVYPYYCIPMAARVDGAWRQPSSSSHRAQSLRRSLPRWTAETCGGGDDDSRPNRCRRGRGWPGTGRNPRCQRGYSRVPGLCHTCAPI
jgi:hypothetical protein